MSKKREHRPTSKEGEQFVRVFKKTHHEKILEALAGLKVGGTHEEIAKIADMRPDQVWKRLSELERDEKIFDTGITRKLKSGVNGIVWQLVGEECKGIKPVFSKPTTKQIISSPTQLSLL